MIYQFIESIFKECITALVASFIIWILKLILFKLFPDLYEKYTNLFKKNIFRLTNYSFLDKMVWL